MRVIHFIHTIKRHLQIWLLFGRMSLQIAFVNRGTIVFFFVGKALRYGMTLLLLWTLASGISQVGPYSVAQITVFFLVFQTVDVVSQMIFRGVYEFGSQVKSGDFDFALCKPINPLFRALLGTPDVNDLLFVIPSLVINLFIVSQLPLVIGISNIALFLLLLINSFIIAAAFHILVLALGILIVEVDNTIMMYRDVTRLTQIPVSLYPRLIQFALFIVIPVGLMMTIPSEVLMGISPSVGILITFFLGGSTLAVSLFAWQKALQKYTSASS
jgi:ABC-2 type transport system permease protein